MATNRQIIDDLRKDVEEIEWAQSNGDAHDLQDACDIATLAIKKCIEHIRQLDRQVSESWTATREIQSALFRQELVRCRYEEEMSQLRDQVKSLSRCWISVEEQMPDSVVLAANFAPGTYGYKEYIIGYVDAVKCTEPDWYRGKCYATNDHEILDNVTHWKPLPEPPEVTKL